MAHFAEVDKDGIVLRVLVVDDLHENDGQTFLAETLNLGGTWIKTSYNTIGNTHIAGGTPLHKNYAGVGYSWDGTGFFPPSPCSSWILDKNTYTWEAPTPKPTDGKDYQWVEEDLNWQEIVLPK